MHGQDRVQVPATSQGLLLAIPSIYLCGGMVQAGRGAR